MTELSLLQSSPTHFFLPSPVTPVCVCESSYGETLSCSAHKSTGPVRCTSFGSGGHPVVQNFPGETNELHTLHVMLGDKPKCDSSKPTLRSPRARWVFSQIMCEWLPIGLWQTLEQSYYQFSPSVDSDFPMAVELEPLPSVNLPQSVLSYCLP